MKALINNFKMSIFRLYPLANDKYGFLGFFFHEQSKGKYGKLQKIWFSRTSEYFIY